MPTSPAAVLWHARGSPNLLFPQVRPRLKLSCANHLLHHRRCAACPDSCRIKPGHNVSCSASVCLMVSHEWYPFPLLQDAAHQLSRAIRMLRHTLHLSPDPLLLQEGVCSCHAPICCPRHTACDLYPAAAGTSVC